MPPLQALPGQWLTPTASWCQHPAPASRKLLPTTWSYCLWCVITNTEKFITFTQFSRHNWVFSPPPAYRPQFPSVNAFFFLVSKGKRAFTRHDLPGYPHTSTLRGESHSNLHKLDLRCRHPYFVTPPEWQHSPACALCYLLLSRAGLFCDSLMNPQLFCRPSFPLDQWDRAAHRGFIWEGELPHAKHPKHMTSVRDWELPL